MNEPADGGGGWVMRLRPRFGRSAAVASGIVTLGVVAVVVVAGVGGFSSTPGRSPTLSQTTVHVPAVTAAFVGAARGQVPWQRPLRIEVAHGRLVRASVTDVGGTTLIGRMTATSWTAAAMLVPSDRYLVRLTWRNDAGLVSTHTFSIRTTAAPRLAAVITPGDGEVVGVGEPIEIQFAQPIPQSRWAAVQRHLVVVTDPPTAGAWHWFDGQDVHWRPQKFWRPGTHVAAGYDLSRTWLGGRYWGLPTSHVAHFQIGAAHISYVNTLTHYMTVTVNGKVVRRIPVSTGRTIYPTMNGVHIVLDKSPSVIMNSATVGIPVNSPNGYYETVYWDVRISDSGEFVHAAPWSVVEQGITNVSHGCVNVSPANAMWFYYFSQPGDVVTVTGSPRPPLSYDPGTQDWNMSWAAWLAGDALH